MNYKLVNAKKKQLLEEKIRVPSTVAGFIILATGITVLLKGVWMTSPLGTLSWVIILAVGVLLILTGTVTVSYRW